MLQGCPLPTNRPTDINQPPTPCNTNKHQQRDSLGALATAIRDFDGGVVLISHNSEFTSTCCNETWVVGGGKVEVTSAYAQRQAAAAGAGEEEE
jgi:hypothetical protein